MGSARKFRWASSISNLRREIDGWGWGWRRGLTGWSSWLSRHVLRPRHCDRDRKLLVFARQLMPKTNPHHRCSHVRFGRIDRDHRLLVWHCDSRYYLDLSLRVISNRARERKIHWWSEEVGTALSATSSNSSFERWPSLFLSCFWRIPFNSNFGTLTPKWSWSIPCISEKSTWP